MSATIQHLSQQDPYYPSQLNKYLAKDMYIHISALGDLAILKRSSIALFSSVKCPGNLILQTYDLAQNLRQADITVVGGFHSPMEREVLTILLRGTQGVVLCPARNIGAKMAREYAQPIEQGRLLILSPFDDTQARITAETSVARNRFVAALADAIFIAYADPGGKLEALCHEVIAWGKRVFAFGEATNAHLLALGVRPMTLDGATRIGNDEGKVL